MKEIKDMTVRELKKELASLHEVIYVVGCYGVRDMVRYYAVQAELDKRGYEIQEGAPVVHKIR